MVVGGRNLQLEVVNLIRSHGQFFSEKSEDGGMMVALYAGCGGVLLWRVVFFVQLRLYETGDGHKFCLSVKLEAIIDGTVHCRQWSCEL